MAGQQFEYGFDDIGNRVSQKRGGDANGANLRSTTYGVNPLNQITNRAVVGSRYLDLIGLAEPGTTVTAGGVIASRRGEFWRSEMNLGNGNPLWQSVNITTSDGGSLANALYRVPPSSEVPTYDADGNLTADGLWTYTWDAENRLISMQSQAQVPAAGRRKLDFEYDPLGRRIGRIVSTGASGSWVVTSTTRWLYEGWNPVAELNSAGTLVREYVWGTDLSGNWQGAGGVGGLLWVLEAPTGPSINAHYAAYDGNGNVMGLVNAADGTWSARYEYGPFGEVIRSTGTMAALNPFRWSTKIQDEDTGLNYYGYRYYSAGMGRWLGRDPIGEEGGLNLSVPTDNGLVNKVDILGLCCGSFAIIQVKDVPVPEEQQGSSGGKDALDGFKVHFVGCDECACPQDKIHLVQAVTSDGGTGEAPKFDGKRPLRAASNGFDYPPYGGWNGPEWPLSYLDGPNNPRKFWGETRFSIDVCAVCKNPEGDKILGCASFTFGDVSRDFSVSGGKPLELEDVKRLGETGGKGSVGNYGFIVPCNSSPGWVWSTAQKIWLDKQKKLSK